MAFIVYADFPTYRADIYKHVTGSQLGGHAVTLGGYGGLNSEKYWKVKSSWNENWGNNAGPYAYKTFEKLFVLLCLVQSSFFGKSWQQ